ncbi:MAG: hypothetical protein V1709_11045, partial [Planctomycetota bacterium]
KISADEKSSINSALERLKKAKDKDDVDEIKKATEELTKSSHTLAQKLYEQVNKTQGKGTSAGATGGPDAGGGFQGERKESSLQPPKNGKKTKGGGDDNIIDAEFETK